MATRTQIDRLAQRIESLVARRKRHFARAPVIFIVDGETEQSARERHYLAHPEDLEAPLEIVLRIVDPPASTPNSFQEGTHGLKSAN